MSGYVRGHWKRGGGSIGRGVEGVEGALEGEWRGSYSSELVGRRKVRDGRIVKTGLQRGGNGNHSEESF